MKYLNYFLILCCLFTIYSCNKETFSTEIDWIVTPEEKMYVQDDYYSVITDDGVLVIMDRENKIRFMDVENQNTLGQFFFSISLPVVNPQEYFECMFYHDNKLWFIGADTLYVYPSRPTNQKPLRKIVFENIYQPRYFALNSTTLYSTGKTSLAGIHVPFKADLSDLWNPIYEDSVYYASTNSYQGVPYESITPRFVHNGSVFSNSEYGISITDANTLSVTNYINIPNCNFELVGDYLFITEGGNIHIYDVVDPKNPKILDVKSYSGNNMAISKDLKKWLVYNGEKIRKFDISDPTDIKLEKVYTIEGQFHDGLLGSMEIHNDLIFLTSGVLVSKKLIIGRLKDY